MNKIAPTAALVCVFAMWVQASEVRGEITLATEMVKKALPPAVYDLRGIAVHEKLSPAAGPGRFGRVAVWLEGGSSAPAAGSATMKQGGAVVSSPIC